MRRKDYKKISPRKSDFVSHSRLWLGKDHLLVVREIGYTDEYKRFYFSDIQSITMLKTRSYFVFSILFAIPLVLFSVLFGMGEGLVWENVPSLVFTLFFFVLLVVHLLRGPTCKCWIRTSVNNEVLTMIRRDRAFIKLIKRVDPLIQAAQGSFSIESISQERNEKEALKKEQKEPQEDLVEADANPPTNVL